MTKYVSDSGPGAAVARAPGVVDIDALAGWVAVLERVAAKRAELDQVETTAREHITQALGDAEEGRIGGRVVVRWARTAAPRRFDAKRFRRENPDLADQYTQVGEPGRRFTLLDPTKEPNQKENRE